MSLPQFHDKFAMDVQLAQNQIIFNSSPSLLAYLKVSPMVGEHNQGLRHQIHLNSTAPYSAVQQHIHPLHAPKTCTRQHSPNRSPDLHSPLLGSHFPKVAKQ